MNLSAISNPGKPSNPFLYLPDGWNKAWVSAKANSKNAPANFIQIGDSIGQGFDGSDNINTNYWGLVRANLLKSYSLGADFWGVQMSAQMNAQVAGSVPWSFTSTKYTASIGSKNYWFYSNSALATTWATFVTPYACTSIDVHANDFNSGTYDLYIDGVKNQTVTGTATRADIKISVTGLSNAVHTITFRNTSGSAACVLLGITTYNPSASNGIYFGNLAYNGAQANDFNQSTDTNSNALGPALFQGYTPQSYLPNGTIANNIGFGFPSQPHLAILELGINDCVASLSLTTYIALLVSFINAFRRGQPNTSVIILVPSNPDGVNSDVRSSLLFTNSRSWYTYIQQMYIVAQLFNCAFVNIHAKWGELGFANGFQLQTNANGPHPTDAGHQDIANVLNGIL